MSPLAPEPPPLPLLRGAPPGALPPARTAVLAHGLEARHLTALLGHPGVRSLHLRDCDLDAAFLRELLASLPCLDALHLSAPALDPAALDAVAALPRLSALTLRVERLPPLDALAGAASLRRLDVGHRIEPLSAATLITLPQLPQLTALALHEPMNVSAALLRRLAALPSLAELALPFARRFESQCLAALPLVGSLSFAGSQVLQDKDLAALPPSLSLRALSLMHTRVRGDLLARAAAWTALAALDLRHSRIKAPWLDALAGHPALAALGLDGLRPPPATLALLAQLPRLRHLHAAHGLRPGPWLTALAANAGLATLRLDATTVADAHLLPFAGAASLEELGLAGCVRLTDRAIVGLAKTPSLRRLDLSQAAALTDASLHALATLPRLESLSVAGITGLTQPGLRALSASASLRDLDLRGTAPLAEVVRDLLASAPREHLDLRGFDAMDGTVVADLERSFPGVALTVDAWQRSRHRLLATRRVNASGLDAERLALANDVPFPLGVGVPACVRRVGDGATLLVLTTKGALVTLHPDRTATVSSLPGHRAPLRLVSHDAWMGEDRDVPPGDLEPRTAAWVAAHPGGPRALFTTPGGALVLVTAEETLVIRCNATWTGRYALSSDGATFTVPALEGAFAYDVDELVAWARAHAV